MPLKKLLPKPAGNQPPPERQAAKRKRGLHHTACNHCRAKREKCSGSRPQCSTCKRHGTECVYEAPLGITRQQANKQKMTSLREVVELLRHGSEADAAVALDRIRQAEDVDEAVDVLALAQALVPAVSNPGASLGLFSRYNETAGIDLPRRPSQYSSGSSADAEYTLGKERVQTRYRYNEDTPVDLPTLTLPISRWTSACNDDRALNHLLTLFWTWDNTVEPSLYRPLFEEDLANDRPWTKSPRTEAFCSPFLVNALLALSCLIDTERQPSTDSEDLSIQSRQFAEEAERHLEQEKDTPSVTLLQGQFAMFAYKGNVGAGTQAIDYFLDAMRTYEALNSVPCPEAQGFGKNRARAMREREGLSWVMWGLYCAEWRVSQAFRLQKPTEKPLIPKLWRDSAFPLSRPDSPSYWWHPYPASLHTQRSMKVEIREVDCHLAELAEDALVYLYPLLHGASEPPMSTVARAIELYDALVQWKFSLPARLRLEDAVLPNAILLHSYVEILLVVILRPFSLFTELQFGPFCPKERCYSHCISLMDTIWSFRAFTGLHSEYWYIPMLATVAFVTLHTHNPVLNETLTKACKCLDEMARTYPLASDALSAVHGALKRKGSSVPPYLKAFLGPGVRPRKDGLLHHAAARLMPEQDSEGWNREELTYQDLLNELEGAEMKEV